MHDNSTAQKDNSTAQKIVSKLRRKGRGWVFTPKDLADLGSTRAVWAALGRLSNSSKIVRVSQGIYNYPDSHYLLGVVPPVLDDVVKAIARRDNLKAIPHGAFAANALGLSDQVPMKTIYVTDGPTRNIKVGNRIIQFKHAAAMNLGCTAIGGLIIQALRQVGKDRVSDDDLNQIRKNLKDKQLKDLSKDAAIAPSWIADHLFSLAS